MTTGNGDDRTVEAIYEALDRQAPEEALVLAEQALGSSEEEDPVVRFLAGIALLEMDHAEEAVEQLGFIGTIASMDNPTSSARTRELLGWQPEQPDLLADLKAGHYFTTRS